MSEAMEAMTRRRLGARCSSRSGSRVVISALTSSNSKRGFSAGLKQGECRTFQFALRFLRTTANLANLLPGRRGPVFSSNRLRLVDFLERDLLVSRGNDRGCKK